MSVSEKVQIKQLKMVNFQEWKLNVILICFTDLFKIKTEQIEANFGRTVWNVWEKLQNSELMIGI